MNDSYKRLVVEMNHQNAGFFVYLQFVINGIIFSQNQEDYLLPPVVDFGENTMDGKQNRYFEKSYGNNIFEYFFYLKKNADNLSVELQRKDVHFFWKLHNQLGIKCYPHGEETHLQQKYGTIYTAEIDNWYLENRKKAHEIIRRHIGIKDEILEKVERKWHHFFSNTDYVLGCHIRGTDKLRRIGGEKISPEKYFPFIDYFIQTKNAKIFLATDDPYYYEIMADRYKERLFSNQVLRDSSNIFLLDKGSPYQKGLEALIDSLMLSKCDFLLKPSSALSEFSIYFNLELHQNSLNLQYECSYFLKKIVLIKERDVGLFSLFLQVVNTLQNIDCFKQECLPIVQFGADTLYYNQNSFNKKNNVWEYYFEPLIDKVDESCLGLIQQKRISEITHVSTYYPEIFGRKLNPQQQIPFTQSLSNSIREIGGSIIKNKIRFKEYLIKRANEFFIKYLKDTYIIGVHIRGTDAIGSRLRETKPDLSQVKEKIDEVLCSHPKAKIFLATDDQNYVKHFSDIYQQKLCYQDCLRHDKGDVQTKGPKGMVMPFFVTKDPMRNGEEVIIDYLVLCKSDFLIHNISSVSRTVLLTRPDLQAFNFNPYPDEVQNNKTKSVSNNKTMNQKKQTLIIHQANGRFGRGFMAEMQCIAISYIFAKEKGYDYFLDDTLHPFLFYYRYDLYFKPWWEKQINMEDYNQVLISCGSKKIASKEISEVKIWDMYNYIQKNVSREKIRDYKLKLISFQPIVENQYFQKLKSLNLPKEYASIHIRRGDKIVTETKTGNKHLGSKYLNKLLTKFPAINDLFICTDDFQAFLECKEYLKEKNISKRLYTLAKEKDTGFEMKKMIKREEVMRPEEVIDLLTDVMICANSTVFVGSSSSNIFKYVKNVHANPANCLNVGW